MVIKDGQKILFIGDSITDCGRRGDFAPMGNGYVKLFRDLLIANYPERKIEIINKGISGNTVLDLRDRWEDDVIYHKPDWLSILIGINDVHRVIRKVDGWENFTVENFKNCYDNLLKKTQEKLSCRIILLEPFYISVNKKEGWRGLVYKELTPYRKAVSDLSRKYKTLLVKLQDIFDGQLKYSDSETFCPEPVHPNQTGHLLIANTIFNILKK
ncbi:MAG: SGNH/GDSL hydrolase family protein [Candidatus Omnitrophica bacterium]|nr:SGNH/GDSL hydrolase family protein [Candidatus Omnitrophota bacterium]